MNKDQLGDRIKRYEHAYNPTLTPRTPVFIRVDGKAFHTFTRGMERPFDRELISAMVVAADRTMRHQMMGCVAAYIQSDECTFMLTDFDTFETQPWFNYELNKIVSVTAAAYTAYFNEALARTGKTGRGTAMFDARAFNAPKEDAANIFIWRQRDWQRNSIQMLARAHFSHKTLQGEDIAGLKQMLLANGVDYETYPKPIKNGTFLFRDAKRLDCSHYDYETLQARLFPE